MKLHITPRQTVYPALYKLTKAQQNDLRNGIHEAVQEAFTQGIVQWNNDITLDLDFRLTGDRHATAMVNVLLNAEDGDIHVRIDHILVHKNAAAAEAFSADRDKQKGTFNRVL